MKFIARSGGAAAFLTATEAVFSLPIGDLRLPIEDSKEIDPIAGSRLDLGLRTSLLRLRRSDSRLHRRDLWESHSAIGNRQSAITMQVVGANPNATVEGVDRLPGISNYFIGNDASKWRTNIPQYGKVRYRNVYAGIDLIYYSNGQNLEYDFEVKPGAKPEQIRLAFQGADDVRLDDQGDLIIEAAGARLLQRKPYVYQNQIGVTTAADFVLTDSRTVEIALGPYDPASNLTVDPEFDFQAVFPGGGEESNFGFFNSAQFITMGADSAGYTYVALQADSGNFSVTPGVFQTSPGASFPDVFILKLNPEGTSVVYGTYLGGDGLDRARALAIDGLGNVYVAGFTTSTNFPTTPGAFRSSRPRNTPIFPPPDADGFVTRINAAGTAMVYSTYLGGTNDDYITSIALGGSGSAVVTGKTNSGDFPVLAGAYQAVRRGTSDFFVSRLNLAGSGLTFSTYLGGSGDEGPAAALALDPSGDIVVGGATRSTDFPTSSGAVYARYLGGSEGAGFVTRLSQTASELRYSTYTGTNGFAAMAVATNGEVYAAGRAITGGGLLEKFSYDGARILLSKPAPLPSALTLDSNGSLYLLEQYRLTLWDGKFDEVLATHLFGGYDPQTYLTAMALNAAGNVYVAGALSSAAEKGCGKFGLDISYRKHETFIGKLSRQTQVTLFVPVIVAAEGLNGSYFSSELTLTNKGGNPAQLHFTYTAAFGGGSGTATDFLAAGQQRIVPDAMAYLRSLGIPLPESGSRGGTLRVHFSGLSSSTDAAVTVRTTTPSSGGQAGLAFAGIRTSDALTGPAYLCGLRQTAEDRSNVAIQNAGGSGEGDVVLRVTVFSGDAANPKVVTLPEERLLPGEFKQFNSILSFPEINLSNAYVLVERISGSAPYYAYAVINDQESSDGSFVPPVPALAFDGYPQLAIPVVVLSEEFSSEVILTNWSPTSRLFSLLFRGGGSPLNVLLELKAGEQLVIPNLFEFLQDRGVSLPSGSSQAWTLFVYKLGCGYNSGAFFAGARTQTRKGTGRYGVFYPAEVFYPNGGGSTAPSVWLYGLRQDSVYRTNLAFALTGPFELSATSSITLRLEIFEGDTGQKVSTVEGLIVTDWKQLNSVLASYAPGTRQGYARVTRVSGEFDFLTYAVVNDGATPGERTGDGTFIASSP